MKDAFMSIYKERIKRAGADKLLEYLEKSTFFEDPASSRYHLAEPGGLVKHSLNVYGRLRELYTNEFARNAEGRIILTPEEEESIAICGLLHDVCKIGVYKKEPRNKKTYDAEKVAAAERWQVKHDELGDFIWETVMEYKFEDNLPFGHGEKSQYMIAGFMKLTRDESMAIRWHMGFSDNDFKAGGQSVGKAFEMYPLAVLTHLADVAASYLDEPRGESK